MSGSDWTITPSFTSGPTRLRVRSGGTERRNLTSSTQLNWIAGSGRRTFKNAGIKAVVITAKHHDGFCLWPSKFSEHTVAKSKWRDGRGDVLKELSAACKEYGLKFGVYLSPWDRNHPDYGTPKYNEVFKSMLREVLTQYGEVHEVWFDGANGEGPNGKRQEYDWQGFVSVVRKHAPNAVIFSDVGPDIRWVGNENGFAGETNWSMLNTEGHKPGSKAPPIKELNEGEESGKFWVPAECDVSIRPGWFWRASENDKVKSVDQLLEIYYRSVGANGALLLNVPPDSQGLIHEADIKRLQDFKARIDSIFDSDLARQANVEADSEFSASHPANNATDFDGATYWAAKSDARFAKFTIRFSETKKIDHVVLREPISLGQRIRRFTVTAVHAGKETRVAAGTTVGNRKILPFSPVESDAVVIHIEDARGTPCLSGVEIYGPANPRR